MIDEMLTAFGQAEGFHQWSFMVSVEPPSVLAGASRAHGLTRSLHCQRDDAFANVKVHGPPRATQVRQVAEALRRAGYEEAWKLKDETGFRRWLPGDRDVRAELPFLRELGDVDALNGRRGRTVVARRARLRGRTPKDWRRAIESARSAAIGWNVGAIGFGRRVGLPAAHTDKVVLEVSGGAFSTIPSDTSVTVCVSVFARADSDHKIPTEVLRPVNEALLGHGYRRRRSKGEFLSTKRVPSAAAASRECARIFASLEQQGHAGT